LVVLRDRVIYEAIVSILDNTSPYATPVGFWKNNGRIWIKFYKGYRTHELLSRENEPVINITRDPLVFFKTAFKPETGGLEPGDYIVDGKSVFLRNAEAYIRLRLAEIVDYSDYSLFGYEILETRLNRSIESLIEPYSRCHSSLIEMIIYATKIKAWQKLTREELETALSGINNSYIVVSKTCRDSMYLDLARKIMEMIESWRTS